MNVKIQMLFVPGELHMSLTSLIIHFPTIKIYIPRILVHTSLCNLLKLPQHCRKGKELLNSCLTLKRPGLNYWDLGARALGGPLFSHVSRQKLLFCLNLSSSFLTAPPKLLQKPLLSLQHSL